MASSVPDSKIFTPLGNPVSGPTPLHPGADELHGEYVSLVPLHVSHFDALYRAIGGPSNASLWKYMLTGKSIPAFAPHMRPMRGAEILMQTKANAPCYSRPILHIRGL